MVGGVGADLPDAGIRLAPAGGDLVGEARHGPPRLRVQAVPGLAEQPCGVEDPAVAVELVLVGGAVPDPHRRAVAVAGPAGELAFGGRVPAVQGEQYREPRAIEAAGMSSHARKARASSCLPTPRNAPMPMLASRGQAKR